MLFIASAIPISRYQIRAVVSNKVKNTKILPRLLQMLCVVKMKNYFECSKKKKKLFCNFFLFFFFFRFFRQEICFALHSSINDGLLHLGNTFFFSFFPIFFPLLLAFPTFSIFRYCCCCCWWRWWCWCCRRCRK